jgi:hypothetical protein
MMELSDDDLPLPCNQIFTTPSASATSLSSLSFNSSHDSQSLILNSLLQYSSYLKEITRSTTSSSSGGKIQLSHSQLSSLQSLEDYLFSLTSKDSPEAFLLKETLQELKQHISQRPCPNQGPSTDPSQGPGVDYGKCFSEESENERAGDRQGIQMKECGQFTRASNHQQSQSHQPQQWSGSQPHLHHHHRRHSSEDELRAAQTTCDTSEGEDQLTSPLGLYQQTPPPPDEGPYSAAPFSSPPAAAPLPPVPLAHQSDGSCIQSDEEGVGGRQGGREGVGRCMTSTPISLEEDADYDHTDDEHDQIEGGKRSKRLNKSATSVLIQWLLDHLGHVPSPYPTTDCICRQAFPHSR